MDAEQYSKLALRTVNDLGDTKLNLCHMAMGIAGEAGEIVDIVKKSVAYGKPLEVWHLQEEIGDVMFYLNGLLALLDTTWEEVFDLNIKKLEARYPDLRFDADKAINRDVEAEKVAMAADSYSATTGS